MEQLKERIEEILMGNYSHLFVPGASPNTGHYELELYADYRDKIPNEQVCSILKDDHPYVAFMGWLSEAYTESRFEEEGRILHDVLEALSEEGVFPDGPSNEEETEVREYLYERVYINEPADHFLSQEICANIFIDTGDGNYDFVLNHVYPAYNGEYGAPIHKDASIAWLAKTQGYTRGQLRKALEAEGKKDEDGFLPSMRVEVANVSTHMNCIAFLVKMEFRTLLKINELLKVAGTRSHAALTVSKDVMCGLYDPWYGGGSVLDIQLEKDVVIPFRYIRSCLPDGGDGYSVASVYGMCNSAWCDVLKDIKASKALLAKID